VIDFGKKGAITSMEIHHIIRRQPTLRWDRHSVEKALRAALEIDHRVTEPHNYLEHVQPPNSDHQRFAADAIGWLSLVRPDQSLTVQKWLWNGGDVAAGESPLDALAQILNERGTAVFEPPLIVTDYFGGCPVCGTNDGHLNVGRDHYVFCAAHKKRSCYGSNLFSGWRDEDEYVWERNWGILVQCEDAEFLVEGVWSADREARKLELESRGRNWHAEVEERRRRRERHAQRVEDVTRVIVEALTAVAEGMTPHDADIKIGVGGTLEITVSAMGVCCQTVEDLPF
jgi:hypothetical protein